MSMKDLDGDGIVSFEEFQADADMDPGDLTGVACIVLTPVAPGTMCLKLIFIFRRRSCHQSRARETEAECDD